MRLPAQYRPALGAIALLILGALVFSPALGAGYLGYDDHWLIRDNSALGALSLKSLRAIFVDLSFENRIALGAEYLPIRDLFTLFLKEVLGLSPEWMHAVHLFVYLVALLIVRAILLALISSRALAELCAILFAVHPVHAESVVWLAGAKDLLALLFSALALRCYIGGARFGAASFFTLLALFSKSTSAILPALFLLCDLALKRGVRRDELALSLAFTAAAMSVHVHVGGVVGMIAPPISEDIGVRIASSAVIFARYLGLSLFVHPHSIVYEAPAFSLSDPEAIGAIVLFISLAAFAIRSARRGERLHLLALGLFFLALAPVSQLIVPLQNRMADRYLLIAVLGPLLSFSALYLKLSARRPRLRAISAAALIAIVSFLGFERASNYADAESLFFEASIRAPASPLGPYQLGALYEAEERYRDAEIAYRTAFIRAAPGERDRRKAGNNWARMLYARGEIGAAREIYEELYLEGPPSGRILYNLARVRAASGDAAGSEAALNELRVRFPAYEYERATLPKSGPLADR